MKKQKKQPARKKEFTYTLSNLQKNWGKKYDEGYNIDSYDTRVWHLEKQILKETLSRFNKNKKTVRILDFASGTGRVAEYLEELGFRNILCMDASNEMLKEARKKTKYSKFAVVDITDKKIEKKFKKESFDIIIAFRFFLNADKELRSEAIKRLDWFLKKSGTLIFNIHGNRNSLRFFGVVSINTLKFILQREKRKNKNYVPYRNQLSIKDIHRLLSQTSLKIGQIYSYSFFPEILSKASSKDSWIRMEQRLISKNKFFGTHLLFICKKR